MTASFSTGEGIYLARQGETFGPYSLQEFEEIQKTGKIDQFSYIWDARKKSWNPIDPPPPPLTVKPNKRGDSVSLKEISAICHDRRTTVSGTIQRVNPVGCELVVESAASSPQFSRQTKLYVSIYSERSKKSVNLLVSLADAQKRGGIWYYRIRWSHCPEMLNVA